MQIRSFSAVGTIAYSRLTGKGRVQDRVLDMEMRGGLGGHAYYLWGRPECKLECEWAWAWEWDEGVG